MFSFQSQQSSSSSSSSSSNCNNQRNFRNNSSFNNNRNNNNNQDSSSFKFNFNEPFQQFGKAFENFQDNFKESIDEISKNIPDMNKMFNLTKSSCNSCNQTNGNIFSRKRKCCKCSLVYCSQCMIYNPIPSRKSICNRCTIFEQNPITKEALNSLKVRDLKWFLSTKNISSHHCYEKSELIDLIISVRNGTNSSSFPSSSRVNNNNHNSSYHSTSRNNAQRRHSFTSNNNNNHQQNRESNSSTNINNEDNRRNFYETSSFSSPSFHSSAESAPATNENNENNNNENESTKKTTQSTASTITTITNIKLDDIKDEDDIQKLTIKQLKLLLTRNFVDFKGCVEREELVAKVILLHNDKKQNDRLKDQIESNQSSKFDSTSIDENQCKVCWEKMIDCVLLECGHMLTCTECGKQLSECPICRQYITRVVHVFRS